MDIRARMSRDQQEGREVGEDDAEPGAGQTSGPWAGRSTPRARKPTAVVVVVRKPCKADFFGGLQRRDAGGVFGVGVGIHVVRESVDQVNEVGCRPATTA